MSQSTSQNQVINYNFYVQNNFNLTLDDLQKARKEQQFAGASPSAASNNIFEHKERAKPQQPFDLHTQDRKPTTAKSFQERISQLPASFSPVETGVASPNLKPKVEAQEKTTQIYETREHNSFQDDNLAEILGYSMIVGAAVFFISFMFAIFGAGFIEETGHILFDFIKSDSYYCYLVPLMVPVSIVFLYFHWLSIKFFRHT